MPNLTWVSTRTRTLLTAAMMAAGGVTPSIAADEAHDLTCESGKVCRETSTLLPLRALPRPFANLYDSKSEAAQNVRAENLPAFRPLFVFARDGIDHADPANPKGWYQVGSTIAKPDGWMLARDVMEWRQALVVSYTHPGAGADARRPVLMFEDVAALDRIAAASDREAQAKRLYDAIERGERPPEVVSIEPKRFVDIEKSFFVLPVIEFRTITKFDDEARLLRIAAAVPRERSDEQNKTTLDDRSYRASSGTAAVLDPATAKELKIDIVFVMDLTGSMGPFIEATKAAVSDVARIVTKDPELKKAIRFGLVGYRDDTRLVPDLEFTAKNFTPKLLDDTAFIQLITSEVKAASVSSDDYTEEVSAGIKAAIDDIPWDAEALRFLVLVGDASAHEPGHKQNTTGLSVAELRHLSDTAKIYTYAVHLAAKRYAKDHATAQDQFAKLAANPGVAEPALFKIDAEKPEDYANIVKIVTTDLAAIIDRARKGRAVDVAQLGGSGVTTAAGGAADDGGPLTGGPVDDGAGQGRPLDPQIASAEGVGDALRDEGWPPGGGELKEILGDQVAARADIQAVSRTVKDVAAAALINYLGGKPVRDITFWAMDRDLIDPTKRALDVRILITKGELNNLIMALGQVVEAMTVAETTQLEFFAALQAVMAQVSKGQDINFDKAQRLAQTRLMPRWIESLPYRSAVLEMNNETYEAMQPEERVRLERSLSAKLQYYIDVNSNVDVWQALDDRGDETAKVFALSLDALP